MERFKFNPDTLSYQRIQPSQKQKITRSLFFIGLTLVAGVLLLSLRDNYIQSPRSESLAVEQQEIIYEMELINRDAEQLEKALTNIAHNDDDIYRVYFEQNPWPATQREAGVGGSNKYTHLRDYKHSDLLIRTNLIIDQVERKLVVQSTSFDEVIEMAWTKEERLAARPAIQPISLKELTRFGSRFGVRFHPILKVVRPHEGIDLSARRGTAIFATADGTVVQAGYRAGGFGKKVLLDHGYGYRTLYGHCNEVLVKPGQEVSRGEVIARVGSTGLSKAPHLHYEVHVNGRPVDPINYYANDLSPEEYDRMIGLLSLADQSFDIN
ncbi:MAG: M23 family metallopeptidase [Bacteroidetes bacterium]|nr:M23 family metallopeptidase [Bacteroidota bacterium]